MLSVLLEAIVMKLTVVCLNPRDSIGVGSSGRRRRRRGADAWAPHFISNHQCGGAVHQPRVGHLVGSTWPSWTATSAAIACRDGIPAMCRGATPASRASTCTCKRCILMRWCLLATLPRLPPHRFLTHPRALADCLNCGEPAAALKNLSHLHHLTPVRRCGHCFIEQLRGQLLHGH